MKIIVLNKITGIETEKAMIIPHKQRLNIQLENSPWSLVFFAYN